MSFRDKIYEVEHFLEVREELKQKGQSLVFTNGCFDILHLGHITYLEEAKNLGKKLLVAVNSDHSVKRLGKGENRPIQDEYSRASILASLRCVDFVLIFEEDTPMELIQQLKPDVLVKGGDYDPEEEDDTSSKYVVGSREVKSWGGSVEAVALVPGYSTTNIEEKLKVDGQE
jgi:rfaE bifunctional protein nucleotidyltransferase chain/domain